MYLIENNVKNCNLDSMYVDSKIHKYVGWNKLGKIVADLSYRSMSLEEEQESEELDW